MSNSPTGPFVNAIGKALIANDTTTDREISEDDIDPNDFIDDDDQAYLYWGKLSFKWIKLKQNMIDT